MARTVLIVAAVAALAFYGTGCGDDGGEEVNVVLSEWIVEPEASSADAGEITFVADNQGGLTHELVVARAGSAEELPVDDDGAFDEADFGADNVVGEVEDVASQSEANLDVDLEPGDYVLLCNIVEEDAQGDVLSHFAEGMHTTFTVQ